MRLGTMKIPISLGGGSLVEGELRHGPQLGASSFARRLPDACPPTDKMSEVGRRLESFVKHGLYLFTQVLILFSIYFLKRF